MNISDFSGSEKKYLDYLNTNEFKVNTTLFRIMLSSDDNKNQESLWWRIVNHEKSNPLYAKAHRNALMLLQAAGFCFNKRDLSNLYSPNLNFSSPPIFENTNFTNSILTNIDLSGAYLKGTNFTGANLLDANLGIDPPLIHSDPVIMMTCAVNKTLIATLAGQYLYLWDYSNGELLKKCPIEMNAPVLKMMFSPDNKALYLFLSDSTLVIWDCASSNIVQEYLSLPSEKFIGAAFVSNFNLLAICYEKSLTFMNISHSGLRLSIYHTKKFETKFDHMAVSPEGSCLATSRKIIFKDAENTLIEFWSIPLLRAAGTWIEVKLIEKFQFMPDGKSLLIQEFDGMAYTRTLEKAIRINHFQNDSTSSIAYSVKDSVLVYLSVSNTIVVWDVPNRRKKIELPIKDILGPDICISYEEKSLLVNHGNQISIFSLDHINNYSSLVMPLRGIKNVCWTSSKFLILSENKIYAYDQNGYLLYCTKYNESREGSKYDISNDGEKIVFYCQKEKSLIVSFKSNPVFSERESSPHLCTFDQLDIRAFDHFFNLAMLMVTESVEIWQIYPKKKIAELSIPQWKNCKNPLVTLGNTRFVLALDNEMQLYEIRDNQILAMSKTSVEEEITSVNLKDEIIIICSKNYLKLVSLDYQPLLRLQGHYSHYDISPNGKYLLTYHSELIEIWDISSAKLEGFFNAGIITGLRYFLDDRFVIWNSEGWVQVHEIGQDERRLLWNIPRKLHIEDVKTKGVIADEKIKKLLQASWNIK